MKEGKNTRSKKTNKPNHSKGNEKPRVREVKIEENFFDEDDKNDKRLVVFSIIAILVILATIVTLVIGCDKKKQEEPEKPIDDIVVPEKKEEDEEEDDGVVTREVVRKVAAVYTGKKTKEDDSDKKTTKEEEEETVKHTVTFDYGDDTTNRTYEEEVEDGASVEPYVPKGADYCYYFTDKTWEEEFDFETPITADTTIYTSCLINMYFIYYDVEVPDEAPDEYDIYEDGLTLVPPTESTGFQGWFTDEGTWENQIKDENDLMDNATKLEDGRYEIHLYAYFLGEGGDDCEGEECDLQGQDSQDAICPEGQTCDSVNPDLQPAPQDPNAGKSTPEQVDELDGDKKDEEKEPEKDCLLEECEKEDEEDKQDDVDGKVNEVDKEKDVNPDLMDDKENEKPEGEKQEEPEEGKQGEPNEGTPVVEKPSTPALPVNENPVDKDPEEEKDNTQEIVDTSSDENEEGNE